MKIQVCTGKICKGNFSEYILKRLENDKKLTNCDNVMLENGLCSGNCKNGPVVFFDGKMETRVTPAVASKLVNDKRK